MSARVAELVLALVLITHVAVIAACTEILIRDAVAARKRPVEAL